MMTVLLLKLLLIVTLCIYSGDTVSVCPVNKLQFLSYNVTLLPRSNVHATSESTSNPLDHFIMMNSQPWCSEYNKVYDPNLHINFTFTETVVVTFLQSSGYFNNYVDHFSMQYALGIEGEMMPYGVLQELQVFDVDPGPNFFPDSYFTLERPMVARRIKLDIHQSVFDTSNRSCWSLMVLGCTYKEATTIDIDDNSGTTVEPCMTTDDNTMTTVYLEPTTLPTTTNESCAGGTTDPTTDASDSTGSMLTIIIPAAVFVIVLCAVIVGVGVLCCYIIVTRKSTGKNSNYHKGVSVKVLDRKNVPVPVEPGNEQKAFVVNGTLSSQKDSVCSESDLFPYDFPRPTMYDVPRTPSQRQQRAATISSNEYKNPIYDGASSKESNTYESIPYDLEQRSRAASDSQTDGTRVRRASDMLPRSQIKTTIQDESYSGALHSSDPQMVQYSVVDKSKKKPKDVPMFEILYDQSSRDDIDTPITS